MEYYQVILESISADQKDILIALLNDTGFTGFEETDDSLKAFINTEDFSEDEFNVIVSTYSIKYSRSIIKEINWNEQWETSFEPVSILHPDTGNPFVHIRANFHQANEQARFDITITPKMSFGTGHHATTYLMAEQMSKIAFDGKNVIDFGTGTAVLAILAEKMGAGRVIAIDNDDWSINNAMENIDTNNCSRISLVKAETIEVDEKACVILANINLNIIIANLSAIKNAAEKAAIVLFSGIMTHDEQVSRVALKNMNFEIKQVFHKNGWIALLTISN